MTPERWRQVERLYKSALEQAEDQRSAFLKQACAHDEALLREVESLFADEKSAGKLPISQPESGRIYLPKSKPIPPSDTPSAPTRFSHCSVKVEWVKSIEPEIADWDVRSP